MTLRAQKQHKITPVEVVLSRYLYEKTASQIFAITIEYKKESGYTVEANIPITLSTITLNCSFHYSSVFTYFICEPTLLLRHNCLRYQDK